MSRDLVLAMYRAALEAADPELAVSRALVEERPAGASIRLLALGKAAGPMTKGAVAILGDRIVSGVVVVPHDAPPVELPPCLALFFSRHPVPDESSVRAGLALLSAASATPRDELVLVLLSGGASSLAEAPAPPLDLEDIQRTTSLLLASGAPIAELNSVRKHLSSLKAGGLLRAAGCDVLTLALSDVAGAPPEVIGSGPTSTDVTTWRDVADVMSIRRLDDLLPPRVRARIDEGLAGRAADTAKPGDATLPFSRLVVVGDGRSAIAASARVARAAGYEVEIADGYLVGDAEDEARSLAERAREMLTRGRRCALVCAAECTTRVTGSGKGGRNQHLALAFALACQGLPGVCLGALATDGVDGPTDAAGAIVDDTSVARMSAAGIDARAHLDACDSHTALDAIAALHRTGASGTNVNDVVFLLVTPPRSD